MIIDKCPNFNDDRTKIPETFRSYRSQGLFDYYFCLIGILLTNVHSYHFLVRKVWLVTIFLIPLIFNCGLEGSCVIQSEPCILLFDQWQGRNAVHAWVYILSKKQIMQNIVFVVQKLVFLPWIHSQNCSQTAFERPMINWKIIYDGLGLKKAFSQKKYLWAIERSSQMIYLPPDACRGCDQGQLRWKQIKLNLSGIRQVKASEGSQPLHADPVMHSIHWLSQ